MTGPAVVQPIEPFPDQRPGTSGLRRRTRVFQQPHYLEAFVQAVLDVAVPAEGATLVLGGDGRFLNAPAIQRILRQAAAHGVTRVWVGLDGLLSTPAASHLIRRLGATGGIILSASHNPGGPDGDFGIKFNAANGGPAPPAVTDAIAARAAKLHQYRTLPAPDLRLDRPATLSLGPMTVEVIDSVGPYADLMESLFDFDAMRALLSGGFRFRFDAMNAVTGPYATEIFERRLGASPASVVRGRPLSDFGGLHPDPNLTYAAELVEAVLRRGELDFGAASDGDGDRNMILGRGRFVSPADSLAVLTAHATSVPGYASGLRGVARSMPTSRAVDRVARALGIPCYVTPTGWKYFGSLLDAGRITLCGEESFGTGSSHLREKDGLWAVLFWLNLLARGPASVDRILRTHWAAYGRDLYSRHDYEALPADLARSLIEEVRARVGGLAGTRLGGRTVETAAEFTYRDPVDGSVASGEGIEVLFEGDARLVLRLSGTGTEGATLRIYMEEFRAPPGEPDASPDSSLAWLVHAAEELTRVCRRSGRSGPTVVT